MMDGAWGWAGLGWAGWRGTCRWGHGGQSTGQGLGMHGGEEEAAQPSARPVVHSTLPPAHLLLSFCAPVPSSTPPSAVRDKATDAHLPPAPRSDAEAAEMAAAVWRTMWPLQRLQQREFFTFGMEVRGSGRAAAGCGGGARGLVVARPAWRAGCPIAQAARIRSRHRPFHRAHTLSHPSFQPTHASHPCTRPCRCC